MGQMGLFTIWSRCCPATGCCLGGERYPGWGGPEGEAQ